jgi:L-alanine-DL-glutamate epimerase-like enolase superfamily enzyme
MSTPLETAAQRAEAILNFRETHSRLPIEEDGTVQVPNRPGLGVALDWNFVNAHRWQRT